jgi:hypothetical protein
LAPDDLTAAYVRAAADDGIALELRQFDWLNEQGHVGLELVAKARRDPSLAGPVTAALAVLDLILGRLRGDVTVLHASRGNLLLPPVPFHEPSGTVLAIDGPEHFTSFRLTALRLYPPEADVGFDVGTHIELCRRWRSQADAMAPGLPAKAFGFGGVQRERAYHDALRDLATPAMGHPPLVRVAAPDSDVAAAYARHREALRNLTADGAGGARRGSGHRSRPR